MVIDLNVKEKHHSGVGRHLEVLWGRLLSRASVLFVIYVEIYSSRLYT